MLLDGGWPQQPLEISKEDNPEWFIQDPHKNSKPSDQEAWAHFVQVWSLEGRTIPYCRMLPYAKAATMLWDQLFLSDDLGSGMTKESFMAG